MNKRMKKKWLILLLEKRVADLERKNAGLLDQVTLLTEAQVHTMSRVERLEEQVSKNAEGTNKNFEELRAEVASNTSAISIASEEIKAGSIASNGKAIVKAIQKVALESEKIRGSKLFSKNGKTILDVLTGRLTFKE
ncbi:hypothetical protein Javan290_0030 [Streptococcus phage Javan290]|uniref:hypothetical protein n=1 Tax=Streptococcus marmotae TaxID=1825069 RepID=UPI00082A4B14|nr:hypothetical protein [Streptococcus marmotae]QBX26084.1 hypothetical protein Javan290_0030 [Streptococcus phage Javan290]